MPNRVHWEADFSVGNEAIDTGHRNLLTQCNLLAEHCQSAGGEEADLNFDQALARFKALAREHFEIETSLPAGCGYPEIEDLLIERDEFDHLAREIITTENFDRLELQRYLTLWCVGHITSAAREQRAFLAGVNTSA